MDELTQTRLGRPFFTRAEALDSGWSDRSLASAVRARYLHRICWGYYILSEVWEPLSLTERYQLKCQVTLHSLGPNVALSHVSAVVAHGLATWGVPLDLVHVTRLDGGSGRIEAGVVHHEGRCSDSDIVEVVGGLATVRDRAVVEASTRATPEKALIHFDSYLFHHGEHDQLMRRLGAMDDWPDTQHLRIPATMADPGSQSPGESRGRWLFWRAGIPMPQCQYKVYDDRGNLVATTDWGWPERGALGEFDGKMKYGRLLKPGMDPGEVVFSEKQREDLVRDVTDYRMVRLVWSDYDHPRLTAERVLRKLR